MSDPSAPSLSAVAAPARPVVFFDGACPLCRREIAHYRRLDRAGCIEWLDLHRSGPRLAAAGIGHAQAMARLHAIDAQGRVATGVDAFLTLWKELPYYRHLARAVRRLRLAGPLELLYRGFAAWRVRGRCTDEVCETPR